MKKMSKKQIIIDYILDGIRDDLFKVGDRIPSEAELEKKFGFGRQTIHAALSELALMQVIKRTPGRGSFVLGRAIRNIQKKMSFTQDMASIGLKAGSKLLEYKIIKGEDVPSIARELRIDPKKELHYFRRLRTGNDTPYAVQDTYIPVDFIDNFDLSALKGSLDSYIEKLGYTIKGFVTKLRAVDSNNELRDLLSTTSHSILNSISVRYLDQNIPLQYTSTFYRSDIYEYVFSSFN